MPMQARDTQLSDQIASVRTIRTLPRDRTFAPDKPSPSPWPIVAVLLMLGAALLVASYAVEYANRAEPVLTPIEIRQQAEHVNYDVLLQHTERFTGKLIKYTGRVNQIRIMDGETLLLLNVSDKPNNLPDMLLGNFDIVLVRYDGDKTIRQGDTLYIYGIVEGRKEFPAPAGIEFTWPLLEAALVDSWGQ